MERSNQTNLVNLIVSPDALLGDKGFEPSRICFIRFDVYVWCYAICSDDRRLECSPALKCMTKSNLIRILKVNTYRNSACEA